MTKGSFYLRANFRSDLPKVDVPFTVKSNGTELTRHDYLGGHPEWDEGNVMILSKDKNQIRYDTVSKTIVGTIGDTETFVDPGGDVGPERASQSSPGQSEAPPRGKNDDEF